MSAPGYALEPPGLGAPFESTRSLLPGIAAHTVYDGRYVAGLVLLSIADRATAPLRRALE